MNVLRSQDLLPRILSAGASILHLNTARIFLKHITTLSQFLEGVAIMSFDLLPYDIVLEIISKYSGVSSVEDLDDPFPVSLLVLPHVCKRFLRAVMHDKSITRQAVLNFRNLMTCGGYLSFMIFRPIPRLI